MKWPSSFSGSKIALFWRREILAYRRDDKPTIPFPGLWDLPEGGREGDETPEECVFREVFEEFGICLSPDRIYWSKLYSATSPNGQPQCFFAGWLTDADVAAIRFGDEGQTWAFMDVDAYLRHPEAIKALQHRVAEFLESHAARLTE
ncbi:hypothetical protein SDC9_154352 [bioreactor metagenome]|uniref:Nudix hydrolase domain-containing protein n=1 Tax=bioreactor metagenome TaxID=1076179 RepID=A0A645F063_9ZZZZ